MKRTRRKTKKKHRYDIVILSVMVLILACLLFLSVWHDMTERNGWATTTQSQVEIVDLEAPPSPFLQSEEAVIIEVASTTSSSSEPVVLPVEKVVFEYVEVIDGCGPHFEGECLNVRTGPGLEYPVVKQLRNGVVLKVGGQVEHEDIIWYKIVFDEWLRYPERVQTDWYIAADYVRVLFDEGDKTSWEHGNASTTKLIVVDRSEQTLTAYEDEAAREDGEKFLSLSISTGLELTPTPRGTFTIFKKTPSRYMQGPLPHLASRDYYDLPGVPWNLYFTHGGAVIHGAYWHNSFGSQYSHGCVNLQPSEAEQLYNWAVLGTTVVVQD